MFNAGDVTVEGFMGSQAPSGGLASVDIAVCTIEKANNICNRLVAVGPIFGEIIYNILH